MSSDQLARGLSLTNDTTQGQLAAQIERARERERGSQHNLEASLARPSSWLDRNSPLDFSSFAFQSALLLASSAGLSILLMNSTLVAVRLLAGQPDGSSGRVLSRANLQALVSSTRGQASGAMTKMKRKKEHKLSRGNSSSECYIPTFQSQTHREPIQCLHSSSPSPSSSWSLRDEA